MKLLVALTTLFASFLCQAFAASPDESPELDAILRRFPKGAVVKQPFRIRLVAYFGDKNTPANMTFEVENFQSQQPRQRLKLGDLIPQTKWRIEKFVFMTRRNEETKQDKDVSELHLMNTDTKFTGTLPLGQIMSFPIVLGLGRGEPVKQQ